MSPLGYLLVLSGVFLIRAVIVGRVDDIPADTKALFLGAISGDGSAIRDVLARRGENVAGSDVLGSASGPVAFTGGDASTFSGNSELAKECERLASQSKGYQWGATGPDYYDCSSLIWRAMQNLGTYKGPRFTTAVFSTVAKTQGWTRLDSAVEGCVINWPGKHMGVSLGNNAMFSARSKDKGIGVSSVSADIAYFGTQPDYWKVS